MPATGYLFQMAGGVPVVTAPAEIDITTAGGLRAILAEWHARGLTTMVVDLTATRFCDSAGLQSWYGRTSERWLMAAGCGWSYPLTPPYCACST